MSFFVFAGSIQPTFAEPTIGYPRSLKVLNISASSHISYADAMNNLKYPEGFSIEKIVYTRLKGKYVVIVRLRKSG